MFSRNLEASIVTLMLLDKKITEVTQIPNTYM